MKISELSLGFATALLIFFTPFSARGANDFETADTLSARPTRRIATRDSGTKVYEIQEGRFLMSRTETFSFERHAADSGPRLHLLREGTIYSWIAGEPVGNSQAIKTARNSQVLDPQCKRSLVARGATHRAQTGRKYSVICTNSAMNAEVWISDDGTLMSAWHTVLGAPIETQFDQLSFNAKIPSGTFAVPANVSFRSLDAPRSVPEPQGPCSPKAPKACIDEAVKLEERGDTKLASDRYKMACENGELLGCFGLANILEQKSTDADVQRQAREYYRKACDGGLTFSCKK